MDNNPKPETRNPERVVQLRKPHACGGNSFEIVQMGPEVVLRCLKCRSIVRMARERFYRASKRSGAVKGPVLE